ncbi:hypothetical protein A9Q89_05780 [Gammaproteobacteria bacterium 53_120_T64]|nr:hypothetical protein A9Q89_05780 [Gammaproteobacteria bacterium 53_120_T64]
MDNKNQAADTQGKTEAGSAAELKSQSKTQDKTQKPTTGKGWRLLAICLLLAIATGLGVGAWFGQGVLQRFHALDDAVAHRGASLEAFQQNIERKAVEQGRLVASFESQLAVLQQAQQSQLALLESKNNAGRGKLLLDEAEFLIRLASQRLLVERRPQGAQTLLESADQVLARLDDPGLTSLRKILSNNITELRRTTAIDREGLFLRIGTLSELMMTFPALPVQGLAADKASQSEATTADVPVAILLEGPWYQRLWQNIRSASQGFVARHFYVRSLQQPLAPLMTFEREVQLRDRLLMTLGNAQQAVLREEGAIYRSSLVRAIRDIGENFAANDDTRAIIEQLRELQGEVVEQGLPDISTSLYALRAYRTALESQFGGGEGE